MLVKKVNWHILEEDLIGFRMNLKNKRGRRGKIKF